MENTQAKHQREGGTKRLNRAGRQAQLLADQMCGDERTESQADAMDVGRVDTVFTRFG